MIGPSMNNSNRNNVIPPKAVKNQKGSLTSKLEYFPNIESIFNEPPIQSIKFLPRPGLNHSFFRLNYPYLLIKIFFYQITFKFFIIKWILLAWDRGIDFFSPIIEY